MKYTAAVITVSDMGARGERVDTSGPAICEMLKNAGYDVVYTNIIPDEQDIIQKELIQCADELKISLILTTGGTGFSPRDITPEATLAVVERETKGIPEAMRFARLKITPKGCLSRNGIIYIYFSKGEVAHDNHKRICSCKKLRRSMAAESK